jgi:hypothetical protein
MGWAERYNRNHPRLPGGQVLHVPQVGDFANYAKRLRAGLDTHGVECDPVFFLGKLVREFEWVRDCGIDFWEGWERVSKQNRDRFLYAFTRLLEVQDRVNLLERAHKIDGGSEQVRRWIRKRIDTLATQEEEAQDHLFELEVAGRLARFEALSVKMAEPDIIIRLPGFTEPIAIACKRPRSAKSAGAKLVSCL